MEGAASDSSCRISQLTHSGTPSFRHHAQQYPPHKRHCTKVCAGSHPASSNCGTHRHDPHRQGSAQDLRDAATGSTSKAIMRTKPNLCVPRGRGGSSSRSRAPGSAMARERARRLSPCHQRWEQIGLAASVRAPPHFRTAYVSAAPTREPGTFRSIVCYGYPTRRAVARRCRKYVHCWASQLRAANTWKAVTFASNPRALPRSRHAHACDSHTRASNTCYRNTSGAPSRMATCDCRGSGKKRCLTDLLTLAM